MSLVLKTFVVAKKCSFFDGLWRHVGPNIVSQIDLHGKREVCIYIYFFDISIFQALMEQIWRRGLRTKPVPMLNGPKSPGDLVICIQTVKPIFCFFRKGQDPAFNAVSSTLLTSTGFPRRFVSGLCMSNLIVQHSVERLHWLVLTTYIFQVNEMLFTRWVSVHFFFKSTSKNHNGRRYIQNLWLK